MSKLNATIDCRGLPPAIAVLRIKQSLHHVSESGGPVLAHLSRESEHRLVAAGLRAASSRVRLFSGEAKRPQVGAKERKAATRLSA